MTRSRYRTCTGLLLTAMLPLLFSACVQQSDQFAGTDGSGASPQSTHLSRGTAALDSGDLASANKAFSTAFRRQPNDPRVVLGLAETHLAKGDLVKAGQLFEMAERASGGAVARSLQGRGLMALRQGQIRRAVRLLRDAVDRDPELWRAWIGLARGHLSLGDRGTATSVLNRIERDYSQNASVLNDIGMVFLTDKVPERALEYFLRALAEEPDHPAARSNIRIARAILGEYETAIAGAAPEDAADALNNAGYAAILNGEYEIADKLLRRALQVSPVFHASARANLELLNQATSGGVARSSGGPALNLALDSSPTSSASSARPARDSVESAATQRARPGSSREAGLGLGVNTVVKVERLTENDKQTDGYRWAVSEPKIARDAPAKVDVPVAAALDVEPAEPQYRWVTDEAKKPVAPRLSADGYRWANE